MEINDIITPAEHAAELRISIIESNLSDTSKAYAVRVGENHGIAFLEMDCITQRHAQYLRKEIIEAIHAHTNLTAI
jgi:hypothetical protein